MATKTRTRKSKPETNGTPVLEEAKPYYQVQHDADREKNSDRKRKILEQVAKLQAEQQKDPHPVDDETLAEKIAYIRPIRDALFRWAEEQVGFGHIDLRCFSDGSAAIDMDVVEPGCRGLKIVLHFGLTLEG
jgi:hypothetical protein